MDEKNNRYNEISNGTGSSKYYNYAYKRPFWDV